ncbi:MAG: outer membrane protein assembly factor BamE domain-containing protein [bacterium]
MFKSTPTALIIFLIVSILPGKAYADDAVLEKRVGDLEARVEKLEQLLDERFSDERWKEGILWSRIRTGMSEEDIRKLLGKPARKEEAIFTTWYYHKTSKDHYHVWFDEGKVLGWEGPDR